MIEIAPSIASGPLVSLQETILELERAGAAILHFDVEDGVFVPEMNIGIKVIRELRPYSKLPFDVHLMVNNPEWLIPELAQMGADQVSVHFEACTYPRRVLRMISEAGMRAGLAFNPKTPIPDLGYCLHFLSYIVVLTTEPERGDSPFLPGVLRKITDGQLQPGLDKILWVADGGISAANAAQAVQAGADRLVVGRGIFKDGNLRDNIAEIKSVITGISD